MGQTADSIRDSIESRRDEMSHDIDELEHRAKEMTDWRRQLDERPMAALGIAAGAGLLIGMMTGGSSDEGKKRREQQRFYPYDGSYRQQHDGNNGRDMSGWMTGERGPSQATDAGKERAASKFDEIRGALMGLAATRAEEFLKEALPGFNQEVEQVQQRSHERSEHSESRQDQGEPVSRTGSAQHGDS